MKHIDPLSYSNGHIHQECSPEERPDHWMNPADLTGRTVLVAVVITSGVEEALHEHLPLPERTYLNGLHVDSWWIAEDDRRDHSDCDSAVFCIPGKQAEARALLLEHGLAH